MEVQNAERTIPRRHPLDRRGITGGIMRQLETDLSILRKFDFEHAPVGVKFLFSAPKASRGWTRPRLSAR